MSLLYNEKTNASQLDRPSESGFSHNFDSDAFDKAVSYLNYFSTGEKNGVELTTSLIGGLLNLYKGFSGLWS